MTELRTALLGLLAATETFCAADIDVEPWLAEKVRNAERALLASGLTREQILAETGATHLCPVPRPTTAGSSTGGQG